MSGVILFISLSGFVFGGRQLLFSLFSVDFLLRANLGLIGTLSESMLYLLNDAKDVSTLCTVCVMFFSTRTWHCTLSCVFTSTSSMWRRPKHCSHLERKVGSTHQHRHSHGLASSLHLSVLLKSKPTWLHKSSYSEQKRTSIA